MPLPGRSSWPRTLAGPTPIPAQRAWRQSLKQALKNPSRAKIQDGPIWDLGASLSLTQGFSRGSLTPSQKLPYPSPSPGLGARPGPVSGPALPLRQGQGRSQGW